MGHDTSREDWLCHIAPVHAPCRSLRNHFAARVTNLIEKRKVQIKLLFIIITTFSQVVERVAGGALRSKEFV